MNPEKIMNYYNKYERVEIEIPGLKKVTADNLVKFIAPGKSGSLISWFYFDESNIDQAIAAEIEYFSALKKTFEWKVYDTDSPANIGDRLMKYGFKPGESESFMVLNLALITAPLPENNLCVEVNDEQGIKDAVSVQELVWGKDLSEQLVHLLELKQNAPESVTMYVIYDQGKPVSAARIDYSAQSPFAGIWSGATLKEYRNKGYYSTLLHKRINDAKRKGVQYLVIDASEMSRPIVEKYGFRKITRTVPYEYVVDYTESELKTEPNAR